jgi:hypothetical protein
MNEFLDFAARHGLALFPCAQGTKRPILKWKAGSTHDRAQWETWQSEHNNLAIDCAKSDILMIDVDSSKVTREEAWGAYYDLCEEWGLPDTAGPMTQSARGGWHIPFKRPAHLAATDLRGGGTLVKISDIRALTEGEEDGEVVGFKNRGYCVAPGSILSTSTGDLPYLLMTDPPAPHDAPEGLLDQIKLKVIEATYSGATGTSDKADLARLVAELDIYGEFSTEPDWFRYMGAIKLALGDTEDGVEVALQMTTDDATAEAFWSRWKRLASVDNGGMKCRIGSMIHRYKELTGKPFNVRKSISAMLKGVTLPSGAGMATDAPTVASPPLQPGNEHKPVEGAPPMQTAAEVDAAATEAINAARERDVPTPPGGFIKTSAQFLAGRKNPDYLIRPIFQRRYVYSITAQTDTGKTSVAMRIAANVAIGESIDSYVTCKKGTVIYFVGENPEDVANRWLGLCGDMGIDPDTTDVHFVEGAMHLSKVADRITQETANKKLQPSLIIVDTSAAYFETDNESDPIQALAHAKRMRSLTLLPGGPCVLVLCHPVKNAADDNLIPRGGSGFLNEVDGNMALRRNGDTVGGEKLGKFRGQPFAPISFKLATVWHPQIVDSDGLPMPTVVARPISGAEVQRAADNSNKDDVAALKLLCDQGAMKQAHVAKALDWRFRSKAGEQGKTNDRKAGNVLARLKKAGLADEKLTYWTATPKGQKAANTVDSAKPEGDAPLTPANLGPAPYPMPAPQRPPMPPGALHEAAE